MDMSRSGLPRVSHAAAAARALCDPHSQPPPSTRLVCGNRSTCLRPSARGTPCATGAPCRAVLEGDVWCSTLPDLSIRPQPSEQQPAQIQGHVRHARRGEDARPGGCGGSRTRVRPGHRPLLTRMHLFPLRLSAAAHIASRIYPRSRGELERQPFLFARWVLPDPTVVYHRRLHHRGIVV